MTNTTPSFTELLALTNKELVGAQEQYAKENKSAFVAPLAPTTPHPGVQPATPVTTVPVATAAPVAQPVPVAQVPSGAPLPPAPGVFNAATPFVNNHTTGQPAQQAPQVFQPIAVPTQPVTQQTQQPVPPAQVFAPLSTPQGTNVAQPQVHTFKPVSAPQPVSQGALAQVAEAVESPKFKPVSFGEMAAGAKDLTTPLEEPLQATAPQVEAQPVGEKPLEDVLASAGITMFAEESKGEIPVATTPVEHETPDETIDKTQDFAVSINALETPFETSFETPATDITPASEQGVAGVTRDELRAIIREVIHSELNHDELKSVVKEVLIDVLTGLTK